MFFLLLEGFDKKSCFNIWVVGSLETLLLSIVGELAVGRSVAVAVGIIDM